MSLIWYGTCDKCNKNTFWDVPDVATHCYHCNNPITPAPPSVVLHDYEKQDELS